MSAPEDYIRVAGTQRHDVPPDNQGFYYGEGPPYTRVHWFTVADFKTIDRENLHEYDERLDTIRQPVVAYDPNPGGRTAVFTIRIHILEDLYRKINEIITRVRQATHTVERVGIENAFNHLSIIYSKLLEHYGNYRHSNGAGYSIDNNPYIDIYAPTAPGAPTQQATRDVTIQAFCYFYAVILNDVWALGREKQRKKEQIMKAFENEADRQRKKTITNAFATEAIRQADLKARGLLGGKRKSRKTKKAKKSKKTHRRRLSHRL